MASILMIDDDKDFCGLVAAHFSKHGHTLAAAHTGAEGLAKAAAVKPDIVFLDISMPDMNGIEVLRELSAGDETSEVPVIIISGKFFDEGMRDVFSQERNFRAFLSKPLELAALEQKMAAALKKG